MAHMMAKLTRSAREYLRAIGAKGGKQKSQRKTEAARANAQRPRPSRRKSPRAMAS